MPLNRFDRCASVASSVRDGAACSLLSCVVATTVVVGASLATLSGCEQSSARAERNAAKEIDSVTQALAAKRLPNPSLADADAVAKARNDLGALANRLTALQGAAPGQMSAANLLAASIEADRGRLAVDRLRLIDAQLRDERSGLATLIATGFALDALASAAERFDPSKDRADLARLRAEAGERVEELKQRAAKLAEPIAQLAAESDSSRAALQELDRSEMDLRSQARAAGPVMGYRFVEQASQKRGEADALRIRMARNDVQLMELKPEQSFAVTDAAQREEIMAQLAAASNDLKAMADDAKAIAEASRKRIGAIREQIARELEAIAGQTNGPAAELASQAEEDFTKSAQLAQRAAGPDAGRDMALAGKESVATAKLALARLAWGQVLAAERRVGGSSRARRGRFALRRPIAVQVAARRHREAARRGGRAGEGRGDVGAGVRWTGGGRVAHRGDPEGQPHRAHRRALGQGARRWRRRRRPRAVAPVLVQVPTAPRRVASSRGQRCWTS
ncbi:MAG: hypothetical protein U0575_16490 [Phycisphaerales bacterium]